MSEFDGFLVNSEGVIDELENRGARRAGAIHYATNPSLYTPIGVEQEYDVAFFGAGASIPEENTRNMIIGPASTLDDVEFVVGGHGFEFDLGPVQRAG